MRAQGAVSRLCTEPLQGSLARVEGRVERKGLAMVRDGALAIACLLAGLAPATVGGGIARIEFDGRVEVGNRPVGLADRKVGSPAINARVETSRAELDGPVPIGNRPLQLALFFVRAR